MQTAQQYQKTPDQLGPLPGFLSISHLHQADDELIWQNFLATHHIIHLLRPDFFTIYKVSKSTTLFQHNISLDLGDGHVTYEKLMKYMLPDDLQNLKSIDKAIILMTSERRLQPFDYIFKVCSTIECPNPHLKRIMRTSFIIHSLSSGLPELVFYCFHDVTQMVSSLKPNNFAVSFDPLKAHLEVELNAKLKAIRPEKANATPREREILRCLHEGMSSKKIASHLFISKATVDTHRQNMLRKWELTNTASLMKKAVDEGWI
ncbi:MAG TPA: LuxR C-terminal-related transcriptional regulator [Saprospiraceae bacterium]|nr:LuxR C-terminal-related transcriptional regulator [Saprospiraceae bacterium]